MSKLTVGVLALQGAFIEHIQALEQLGVHAIPVRLLKDLDRIQGLIIPGGESTVIGRLLHQWNLWEGICHRVANSTLGVWGSCAGAILLAKRVPNLDVKGLQVLDITVMRNAFGRQKESFIAPLKTTIFQDEPFLGVFIRAPIITEIGKSVTPIACLENGTIVAAQENLLLATAFHPELTQDLRFHNYFINMLKIIE